MTGTEPASDLTDDLFLGGALRLLQPRRGHRFGGDAALLAAAGLSRMSPGAAVADLGAGVGAVGLALCVRGAGAVALVEIDPNLSRLARENAARNGLADAASAVCADVADIGRPRGPKSCPAAGFALVVANPPFDDAARFRASPEAGRAHAHGDAGEVIETWMLAAVRLLRPGGSLVMIHRPEALGALIPAFDGRFGDLRVRPVHPRADAPAARVLLAARKGRRGALAVLPGVVMHAPDGGFTAEADGAQRGETPIAM